MFFYDDDRKLLNEIARNNESILDKFIALHEEIGVLIQLLKNKDVNICVKSDEKKPTKKTKSSM